MCQADLLRLPASAVSLRSRCPAGTSGNVSLVAEPDAPGVSPVWAVCPPSLLSLDCYWHISGRDGPSGRLAVRTTADELGGGGLQGSVPAETSLWVCSLWRSVWSEAGHQVFWDLLRGAPMQAKVSRYKGVTHHANFCTSKTPLRKGKDSHR